MVKMFLAAVVVLGLVGVARADGEVCEYDPSAPTVGCPDGEMCSTGDTCGAPCGENFACSADETCWSGNCVPACVFTDEGCQL